MAAKVINFHSPDGKNTYELTFTRDSVEATERAGFQIGQYTQMTNLLSNSRALFYGAFIARNKGIKRKVVDEMFQTDELSRYLARMKLTPQWEEGVFDRLTAGEVPGEELGQPQKGCRIWQLRKDVDVTMRFIG